jgi:hypothetical protein
MIKLPVTNKTKTQKPHDDFDFCEDLFSHKSFKRLMGVCIFSFAVPLVSWLWQGFAEGYSITVGRFLRMLTAKISGIFPFSVFELIVVLAVFCGAYAILRSVFEAVIRMPKRRRFIYPALKTFVCFCLAVLTVHNLSFAASSHRRPVEENMAITRKELTIDEIYKCALVAADTANQAIKTGSFRRTPDGSSLMPYSYNELFEKLNTEYSRFSDKYRFIDGFSSKPKRIALSSLMMHTHISGIYIPYTGEANINIGYPHYVTAFSCAHEMAHQRGVAHEDEANFVAFVLLYESDDPYLRYCAAVQLLDYLLSPLAMEDYTLYYDVVMNCENGIMREIYSFYDLFEPYSNSVASHVAGAINDASIKLRGDSEGEKSYGLMTELVAAYLGVAG